MIRLEHSIIVKADQQICWMFMSDLSNSLAFNRFHVQILTEPKFSFKEGSKFIIVHNFGFGNHNNEVVIKSWNPPRSMTLIEHHSEDSNKSFPHNITFRLKSKGKSTELVYLIEGTYGNRVQDATFKPILKGIIVEELYKIKQAIESTISSELTLESGSFRTI